MRFLFSCLGALSSLTVVFSLTACGSSSSSDTGGVDASMPDATNGTPSADAGGTDAADASDAAGDGALVDAGPVCSGAESACQACCATAFPAGSKNFDTLTLQCACAASLCGPLDGGTDDAGAVDSGLLDAGSEDGGSEDGAVYGVGACTATCNGTAYPNAACNTCIYDTLGSVSNLGVCGNSVAGSCLTDTTCAPYLQCIIQCN